MAAGPFEADLAAPFGVAPRGGAVASPKLVAILRPRTTTWVVPRTSKYTIHGWGPGGGASAGYAGGGAYFRKTAILQKGVVLTVSIGFGGVGGNFGVQSATGPTTLTGAGLNLSAAAGGDQSTDIPAVASGGDLNVSGGPPADPFGGAAGGDGTVIGSGGIGGRGNTGIDADVFGKHPGGGMARNNIAASSGSGEIRIVDETP